jgi:hypothetical protein
LATRIAHLLGGLEYAGAIKFYDLARTTLGAKTKHSVNRASQAFRQAAAALRSSKSALGAYYRRLCGRMDKGKAVTAAAHKLARLFYALMTKGQEYVDQGQQYYEERYRQRVIHHLQRRAQSLGMSLMPTA